MLIPLIKHLSPTTPASNDLPSQWLEGHFIRLLFSVKLQTLLFAIQRLSGVYETQPFLGRGSEIAFFLEVPREAVLELLGGQRQWAHC